jgi:hypothetical protein
MKKPQTFKVILALAICFVLVSCDLFNTKKFANVIMVEGPRLEDAGDSFSYTGRVLNRGEGKANWVKVYINIFDSLNSPMVTNLAVIDETHLAPGESSTWRVTFNDADYEIRDLMDPAYTTYDIDWTDE